MERLDRESKGANKMEVIKRGAKAQDFRARRAR